MRLTKNTITLLLLLFCNKLLSQDLEKFNKLEGLNSYTVYCVIQDSKGFIWLGTDAGVTRYDGYKFINYNIDDGLTDSDIFQVFEDDLGRLWFLTNSGKPTLYDNGKLLNASNTAWLANIQPSKLAVYIKQFDDRTICYATLDTAYIISNNKVINKYASPKLGTQTYSNIQAVTKLNNDIILIQNSGIYNTRTKQNFQYNPQYIVLSPITKTLITDTEVYYFYKDSVYSFNLLNYSSKAVGTFRNKDLFLSIIKNNNTDSVTLYGYNSCYKYNIKTQKISKSYTTNNFQITGLLNDAEGNMWFSSLNRGVFFKKKEISNKAVKITNSLLNTGIAATTVTKISDKIFIGYNDGVYLLKGKLNTEYFQLAPQNRKQSIKQIYQIGRYLFFLNSNQITIKKNNQLIERLGSAKQITENDSAIYIASTNGTFKLLKTNFNNFLGKNYKNVVTPISKRRSTRVLSFSSDSLFAGGIDGLQLFIKELPLPKTPWNSETDKGYITKIIKLKENVVAISTKDKGVGIIYGDTIFSINKKNGLLVNNCKTLYSCEKGALWVVTTKGINKILYTINSNRSINYKVIDYSKAFDFSSLSINDVVQSNDTLFVATDEGAYYNILNKEDKDVQYTRVYIESVKVGDSIYQNRPEYHLKYWQNNVEINYVGLSFQYPGKIKYRYKLIPIDTFWHETENIKVEYPYLNSGHYEFIVTACLPNGIWNPQMQTIKIDIETPYWRTLWFIIVICVLSTAVVSLFVYFLFKNMRHKHLLQNQKLTFEKQLSELEYQSLQLQMNPHFIFNAIYAIQGFYASGNLISAKQYISKLANLVRKILESVRQNRISLEDEINLLKSYLELFALKYNGNLKYEFVVDKKLDASKTLIPPMLIQPIVENALLHGIGPLKEGGELRIEFNLKDTLIECKVLDNGIGRVKSAQLKQGIEKQSIGLETIEKRLKLLFNSTTALSVFEINDAFPLNENTGTIVTLQITLQ